MAFLVSGAEHSTGEFPGMDPRTAEESYSYVPRHLHVDTVIREIFVIRPTVGLAWPGRQLHRRVRLDRVGVSAGISPAICTGAALWLTVAKPSLCTAGSARISSRHTTR